MTTKIDLVRKLDFGYKSEDFIPCFIGFNKRVNRIAEMTAPPSSEKKFVGYLNSSAGFNKAQLFLMYHFYTSGAAVLGIGMGIAYLIDHLF